jgi:small subunit ribosomal protein S5
VVKGGRRFGLRGACRGRRPARPGGFGHGKAREVPERIRKATESAKRALIRVPLREGRTLHHDVIGRTGWPATFRAARPAPASSPAGPMRRSVRDARIQDVVAKSMGSSNPYNMCAPPFDALKHEDSPRSVAARRGIKVFVRCKSRRATPIVRSSRRDGPARKA